MTIKCPHCHRDNFKREEGLSQHLATKEPCASKYLRSMTCKVIGSSHANWTFTGLSIHSSSSEDYEGNDEQETARREGTGSPGNKSEGRQCPETPIRLRGPQNSKARFDFDEEEDDFGGVERYDLSSSNDDNPQAPQRPLFVRQNSNESLGSLCGAFVGGDDEDTEGKESEKNGGSSEESEEVLADTSMMEHFDAFCDPNRHVSCLTKAELTGIRLMKVLRRHKAPMKAYKDTYKWLAFEGEQDTFARDGHEAFEQP